ncbi:DUF6461 domain-containing protein [Actinomadura sp. ATCC 39365]
MPGKGLLVDGRVAGGWTGILPARSDDAFLLSLTEGGRHALSFSMDINGHDRFKYIRDGNAIVSFRPTWPDSRQGSDPHAPDHLMDGLRFQASDDPVEEDEPRDRGTPRSRQMPRVTSGNSAASLT